MASIQPELWVETPREAVAFYEAAFGATVVHRVGEGEDVVAQLGVGDAAFWVAATSVAMKRLSPSWAQQLGSKRFDQLRNLLLDLNRDRPSSTTISTNKPQRDHPAM
jgi:hypothetical protein